jgi:hypothetical protein
MNRRVKLHSEELHNVYSSHSYHKVDQIKDNEVGGACGTHGKRGKSVQGFGGETRRKETTGNTEA